MTISLAAPADVVATAVRTLGFDATTVDLTAPEVMAAGVRRAASVLCPTTPRNLATAIRTAARGLVEDLEEVSFPVRTMIDSLVGYGDLLELPITSDDGNAHRTLFLAEPAFVRVGLNVVLMGIRGDGVPLLGEEITSRVELDGHVRRMSAPEDLDAVAAELQSLGLREVSEEHWLSHPPFCDPHALVADYEARLAAAGPAGTIEGCTILDGSKPANYYRGRWRPVSPKDSGAFVARRPREYGADAWCYAQVERGEVVRLVDLPMLDRLNRACDEAWRLQAAKDAVGGRPQQVRVTSARPGSVLLDFLSPPPSWAQRRLDCIARPVPRQRSVLSYVLGDEHLLSELDFLERAMWTLGTSEQEMQ